MYYLSDAKLVVNTTTNILFVQQSFKKKKRKETHVNTGVSGGRGIEPLLISLNCTGWLSYRLANSLCRSLSPLPFPCLFPPLSFHSFGFLPWIRNHIVFPNPDLRLALIHHMLHEHFASVGGLEFPYPSWVP